LIDERAVRASLVIIFIGGRIFGVLGWIWEFLEGDAIMAFVVTEICPSILRLIRQQTIDRRVLAMSGR
jgi:hypothetical protein